MKNILYRKKYKIYKRGQIIMANFSPQQGHEIKGPHYAVVITKNDGPYFATLTVIPLTSKKKKYLLNMGTWLADSLFEMIKNELNNHIHDLKRVSLEISNSKINDFDESVLNYYLGKIENLNQRSADINRIRGKYSEIQKVSYANVLQITTIDKSRIIKPLNKMDPIQEIKIPSDIMDKIDSEIIRVFTNQIASRNWN